MDLTRRELDGKIAIVTGAAAGIGEAAALLFGEAGATVVACDVDEERGGAVVETILRSGGQGEFVRTDVSDESSIESLVHNTLDKQGRIDVVANIAGIVIDGEVEETTSEEWHRCLDVNLSSIYYMCHHVVPVMKKMGGGCIVNMASVAGLMGLKRRAAYCASKGGVVSLTRSMARAYAEHSIRVNCVCPGTVDSPSLKRRLEKTGDYDESRRVFEERQPLGRFGKPEEIAHAVLYLASDRAAFVTGSALVIDGGMSL